VYSDASHEVSHIAGVQVHLQRYMDRRRECMMEEQRQVGELRVRAGRSQQQPAMLCFTVPAALAETHCLTSTLQRQVGPLRVPVMNVLSVVQARKRSASPDISAHSEGAAAAPVPTSGRPRRKPQPAEVVPAMQPCQEDEEAGSCTGIRRRCSCSGSCPDTPVRRLGHNMQCGACGLMHSRGGWPRSLTDHNADESPPVSVLQRHPSVLPGKGSAHQRAATFSCIGECQYLHQSQQVLLC
jgi:hypothetical protein